MSDFLTVLPGNPGLCGAAPSGAILADQYTYDYEYYYADYSHSDYNNSSSGDYSGQQSISLPPC